MPHDIYLPRDTDYEQPCVWVHVSGSAVNLSGVTLTANVKSYPARATVNLSPTVVVTDMAAGEFEVQFTAAQSAALRKGRYVWEVLANAGSGVQRILSGVLRVQDTGDEAYIPATLRAVQDVYNATEATILTLANDFGITASTPVIIPAASETVTPLESTGAITFPATGKRTMTAMKTDGTTATVAVWYATGADGTYSFRNV